MRIYVWFPIVVSLGLGFTFMNIPPLNRQFMELLNVDYAGLSWLLSGLFWSHALGQLPAGLISDRFSPWSVMVAGLAICILANLLPFINPHSAFLATGMRFFLGAGTSLSFLAMMKVVFIMAPAEKLSFIQGLQGAGFSFGFVLPYLILPHLGEAAWPYSYLAGVVFLLAGVIAAFFLPRAKLTTPADGGRSAADLKQAVGRILTSKAIWMIGIFHGLSYGSMNNLGNWLPSIMADMDGLDDPKVWASAAVALLLAGTFGRAFAGPLLSRFSRSQVVNGSILVIGLLYCLMGLSGAKYLTLGTALVMSLACGATYGGVFSLSAGAVEAAYAATAMGVMNMIANFFNVGLTLFFGYIRQYTGGFTPCLIAAGIIALAFWLLGRHIITAIEETERKGAL